jgi:predicted nucleic acid-binding protein
MVGGGEASGESLSKTSITLPCPRTTMHYIALHERRPDHPSPSGRLGATPPRPRAYRWRTRVTVGARGVTALPDGPEPGAGFGLGTRRSAGGFDRARSYRVEARPDRGADSRPQLAQVVIAGRDVLLDTGPRVATLDARDQWHAACLAQWPELIARCVTTEAVLTEAGHLVSRAHDAQRLAVDFVLAAGIPIASLDHPAHQRVSALMKKYAAVPMDYADATLVAVAEALSIKTVFTLDRRGFRTYRIGGSGRFAILP